MKTNDVFRRVRFIFDYDDHQMIDIFSQADFEVTRSDICDWLKKEDEEAYMELTDLHLATFLNGFIVLKRGKRDGPAPEPETVLDNNLIFKKLKIALNLKTDDILDLFDSIDKDIGVHELNAFFRNPKQKQYRECQDQYLRYFLSALQAKFRPDLKSD